MISFKHARKIDNMLHTTIVKESGASQLTLGTTGGILFTDYSIQQYRIWCNIWNIYKKLFLHHRWRQLTNIFCRVIWWWCVFSHVCIFLCTVGVFSSSVSTKNAVQIQISAFIWYWSWKLLVKAVFWLNYMTFFQYSRIITLLWSKMWFEGLICGYTGVPVEWKDEM